MRSSESLAANLLQAEKDDKSRLDLAYRTLFARAAEPDELTAAQEMMQSLEEGEEHRWTTLIQAILGSSEFRYVF